MLVHLNGRMYIVQTKKDEKKLTKQKIASANMDLCVPLPVR